MAGLLSLELAPRIVAGGALLGLAFWLLYLDRRSRIHQALALFFLLRGVVNLGATIQFAPPPLTPAALQGDWTWVPAWLAIPFALAYFLLAYRDTYGLGRMPRWLPTCLLVGAIGLAVLYLASPGLYIGPAEPGSGDLVDEGPLSLLDAAPYLGYALVALVLARDHERQEPGPLRTSLLILSFGFATGAVFVGTLGVFSLLTSAPFGWNALFGRNIQRLVAGTWLLLIPLIVTLVLHARREPKLRAPVRRYLLGLSLPVFSVIALLDPLVLGWTTAETVSRGIFLIDGVWTLVLPGAATYALVRHQLFGLDVQLKRSVRTGTLLTVVIGGMLVAAGLSRLVFPDAVSNALAVVTVALLVGALARLNRIADQVANAAFPQVEDSPAALQQRKLEAYRAALEAGLDDEGRLPATHEAYLERLRTRLGVSERDHGILVQTLVGSEQGNAIGPHAPEPGTVLLARYRIDALLGEGGQGRTYAASDTALGRRVAIKILQARGDQDALLQEARALTAVAHPRIVTVYDVEIVGRSVYIVMELVDGGSLDARLVEGPLSPAAFAQVASDLLVALERLHAREGLHRDVKPSNVLVDEAGRAKLADFGIASLPGQQGTAGLGQSRQPAGTLRYMSPEQAKGQRVTPASDLYSAAVTLYEAFTGEPFVEPRDGETMMEVQMRVASAGRFERELGADAPERLERWFERALAPSPEDRFSSAGEMREAFEAIDTGPLSEARSTGSSDRPR